LLLKAYLPSLVLVTSESSEIGSVEETGKLFCKEAKGQVDTETQQPVAVQIKERSRAAKP